MATVAEEMDRLRSLPPDEPIFILRAQDVLAPTAIRFWAFQAAQLGAPAGKCNEACMLAARMDDWTTRRVPD